IVRVGDITDIRLCDLFKREITFRCPHLIFSSSLANYILSMSLCFYHLCVLFLKESLKANLTTGALSCIIKIYTLSRHFKTHSSFLCFYKH
uniref:Uncharacterized protein n=1 Tax=Prolemur simus TaxID=1328070 RepID=A0A8C8ZZ39_PROSS